MRRTFASGSTPLRLILWLAGILAVLLAVAILPFRLVRNEGIRAWLIERSLHRSVLAPEWHLRIERVERLDPAGLTLRGIHLVRAGPEGEREWGSLRYLDVRWKPRNLLRRRLWADRIALDSLALHLDVPPPRLRSEGGGRLAKTRGHPKLPWLRLDAFGLEHVEVWNASGLLASGSLSLAQLAHHNGEFRARFDRGRFYYPADSITVALDGGKLDGTIPGRLRLAEMLLTSEGVATRLYGEAVFPEEIGRRPSASARLDVDWIIPTRVRPIRRLELPFAPEDSLGGTVRAEIDSLRTTARIEISGLLLGGPLATCSLIARKSGDSVIVEDLSLNHRAGAIRGSGRLQLDSLLLRARIALARMDLSDPSLAAWLAGAPQTRIDGTVEGEAVLARGRERARAEGELHAIRILGRGYGPLRFRGSLADSVVTVDSLVVGKRGSGLRAHGAVRLPDGPLDAVAALDGLSLEETVGPWVAIPIEGIVSGEVILSGTARLPHLDGRIEGRGVRAAEARAQKVLGDSLAGPLVPLAIGGHLRAQGLDIYGVPADSADLRVEWGRTMRVEARASRDSLRASALVDLTPAEPGSLTVEGLRFEPGSLPPWEAARPIRVSWSKGSARIEDASLESSDGKVEGSLAVGTGGSSLEGSVRVRGFDLRVPHLLLGLPDSSLAGIVDADAAIGGTPRAPAATVNVEGREVVAARWPVGRFSARGALASGGEVRIDSLRAGDGGGNGRVRAAGLRARVPVPLPVFLRAMHDPDSLSLLLSRTEIAGRILVDSLSAGRLAKTGLEAGHGQGAAFLAESADPMLAKIRTIRAGQNGEPASVADAVEGTIELDVEVGGTAAEPRGTARGGLRAVRLYQARADSILFAATYAPGDLVLDSLVWREGDRTARARGSLPLVIRTVPGEVRVPKDRPIAFDAQLPDIDLAVLGVLSRDILEPAGILSGSVSVRGTARRIWPEGVLAIRGGGLRIPKREERLRKIDGTLDLDSTGIKIRELSGRIGEDGRFHVTGWFRDMNHFDLEAKVRDATFFETGLYHFTADADLNAFPVVSALGSYPLIVGTAEVHEGTIIGDLAKQPPPPAGTGLKPSPWHAEIDITAPGNMRLSTAVASVDLGEGEDLHVSFVDPILNVSGRIKVLGGRYRVFNNVFTITSGTVEFQDTGQGPVPILDVNAETKVRSRSAENPEDITVRIHAKGPVTQLAFEFSSDQGLAEDEIVELLSIGRLTNPTGTIAVTDPSRQYLFTELVAQLESQMSRIIAPLENIEIQPGLGPNEAWKINYRQTLLPQVSVAYTRELAATAGQELSLHYNLRGQLYLNAGLERRQALGGTPVDRYTLDLKLRFEYK